jgi:cytochrome P450
VDGAEHRRQRRLLSPAFTAERIKLLIPTFWTKACELRKLWVGEGNVTEYDVCPSLIRTMLDAIGLAGHSISLYASLTLGFGYDFGALKDSKNPVAQAYFTIFDNAPETWVAAVLIAVYPILEYLPVSWIKRGNDAKKTIIDAATTIIDNKSDSPTDSGRDILGCMLQESKRLEILGEKGLTKEEMINQILTFLVAGLSLVIIY